MKLNIGFIFVLFFISNLFAQIEFNQPESVVFDANSNSYLISNTGDGRILKLDEFDVLTVFYHPDNSVRGLHIFNGKLYAAGNLGLHEITLTDTSNYRLIEITGNSFLNDVQSDGEHHIYISDSGNKKVFSYNLEADFLENSWQFDETPNGLLLDPATNRLLITFSDNTIQQTSITSMQLSWTVWKNTSFGQMDGLAIDNDGNIYVSSWETGIVYRFRKDVVGDPDTVATGFNGPADIYYCGEKGELAVPEFNDNEIKFISIGTPTAVEDEQILPEKYILNQNYPNPFNPSTSISFSIPESGKVKLLVFDLLGKQVAEIINQDLSAGNHSVNFNAENLSSGIYIYKFISQNFTGSKKMLLIK